MSKSLKKIVKTMTDPLNLFGLRDEEVKAAPVATPDKPPAQPTMADDAVQLARDEARKKAMSKNQNDNTGGLLATEYKPTVLGG